MLSKCHINDSHMRLVVATGLPSSQTGSTGLEVIKKGWLEIESQCEM